jgi:rhomboid protease GluP
MLFPFDLSLSTNYSYNFKIYHAFKSIKAKDQDLMPPNFEILFSGLSEKKSNLIVLILSSQHIKTYTQREGKGFNILVEEGGKAYAYATVRAYEQENKTRKNFSHPYELSLNPFSSGAAICIMGLLTMIHFYIAYIAKHEQAVLAYGSSSLFIQQGETFRAVTALFLHADVGHLLGNLAGIIILVAPFFKLSGFGTGPFMLLMAGTTGNLLTAAFYRNAHLSIGASTAIMGAAGLLAAFHLTLKNQSFSFRSILPIPAGITLVLLFSQGERTDIMAHIFGFASGFVFGIPFFPLIRMITFSIREPLVLFISLLIIIASFLSGS